MNAGIVLCGGRSSRMGRAKALLPWRGRPMVAHVVETLRAAVDEVVVVSSPDLSLPPLDAKVVVDREPGLGPLAGIREGLAAIESDRAFVSSTDAPYLTPTFVRAFFAHEGAVATEQDGYVQTIAAVYPRAALARAEALLAAGRMRPLFLLEEIGFTKVDAAALPDAWSLRGFNTPDEYLAAVRAAAPDATATLELFGRARVALGEGRRDVAVGTLADVLRTLEPRLSLFDGDEIARYFLVSIDGRGFTRDGKVPIGPGETVIVLDAASGG